VVESLNSLVRV